MTIFLRGRLWWYEFKCAGVRYRESTGTEDPELATAIEQKAKKEVARQQFADSPLLSALLPDLEKKMEIVDESIEKILAGEEVDVPVEEAMRKPRPEKLETNPDFRRRRRRR
jgi:hypothetical protein